MEKKLQIIKLTLFLITVVFIIYLLSGYHEDITTYEYSLNIYYFSLAILLVFVGQHISAYSWCKLARTHRLSDKIGKNMFAWFVSRLGRYVPGKTVWLLNRVFEYKDVKQVGIASILEILTNFSAVLLVLFIIGNLNTNTVVNDYLTLISVLIFPIVILLICPEKKFRRVVERIVGEKSRFPGLNQLRYLLLLNVVSILIHTCSFFILIGAISGQLHGDFSIVLCAYYLAGLIGILAIFAPAGIGVREAALILFLKDQYSIEIVIVATILIRIIGIFSEVISTLSWEKISKREIFMSTSTQYSQSDSPANDVE